MLKLITYNTTKPLTTIRFAYEKHRKHIADWCGLLTSTREQVFSANSCTQAVLLQMIHI